MAVTKKSLISNSSPKKTKKSNPTAAGGAISSAKLATAMKTTLRTTLKVGRSIY